MKSFSTTSQVVLQANPNYWGPKPAWSTIVIRNTATAAIERLDVQRGTNEIAIDLDPSQAKGMTNVQVHAGPSPNVMFLFTNDNPKISKISSNHDFQQAHPVRGRLRRHARSCGRRRGPVTGRYPDCPSRVPAVQRRRQVRPRASEVMASKKSGLGPSRRSSSLTRPVSPSTVSRSTTPPPGWSNTSTRSASTSRSSPSLSRSASSPTAPAPKRSASGTGARLPGPAGLPGVRPWQPGRSSRRVADF